MAGEGGFEVGFVGEFAEGGRREKGFCDGERYEWAGSGWCGEEWAGSGLDVCAERKWVVGFHRGEVGRVGRWAGDGRRGRVGWRWAPRGSGRLGMMGRKWAAWESGQEVDTEMNLPSSESGLEVGPVERKCTRGKEGHRDGGLKVGSEEYERNEIKRN